LTNIEASLAQAIVRSPRILSAVSDTYDAGADARDPEAVERATCVLREAAALAASDLDHASFFGEYIENNEPELALGELAYFADERPASPLFWRLLADAAELLRLTEDKPYHGAGVRVINRHLTD
jgi:predicted Zn-dependent protease